MKSLPSIVLLAAVVLSSRPSATIAQAINTDSTDTMATGTSPHCELKGITWQQGYKYIAGAPGVFPSVYARCDNGATICFKQDKSRDKPRSPIDCNTALIGL